MGNKIENNKKSGKRKQNKVENTNKITKRKPSLQTKSTYESLVDKVPFIDDSDNAQSEGKEEVPQKWATADHLEF